MIEGEPTFLTDDQWLTLLKVVSDDKPIKLTMPRYEKDDTKLLRDNRRWTIHPDGSAHWEVLDV